MFNCTVCRKCIEVGYERAGEVVLCQECGEPNRAPSPRQNDLASGSVQEPPSRPFEFRWPDGETVYQLVVGAFVVLAVVGVLGIVVRAVLEPAATPEQMEKARVQREAKERLERETDEALRAVREAQIQVEMKLRRKKRGY